MSLPLPPRNADGSYTFIAGMAIDADGANGQSSPPVYAPKGYKPDPLDYLANAGEPGNWYGVVTSGGIPIVQSKSDPAPGAYVSATSYQYKGHGSSDPRAYVDANAVPYIVIPGHWRALAKGVVLGCRATVTDSKTGLTHLGAVLDFGPKSKCGEASIAMARLCGVPTSPKNGGTEEKRFTYCFYPGVKVEGFDLIPA